MYETPVRKRLPVWAVVKRSYGYVWDHRVLLSAPLLLVFAAHLASELYIQNIGARYLGAQNLDGTLPGPENVPKGLIWLASVSALIFSMTVVVGIHRTVLLDETRRGIGFLRLDGNLLRYVGIWLVLLLLAALFIVISVLAIVIVGMVSGLVKTGQMQGMIIPLATLLIVLLLIALFLRFMLALPAAAVGARDGLGVSWSATRGNWLRLLAAVILTFLPFIAIDIILAIPTMHSMDSMIKTGVVTQIKQPLVVLIGSAAVKSIDLAVLTVMLSLCYDVLVRGRGPGNFSQAVQR